MTSYIVNCPNCSSSFAKHGDLPQKFECVRCHHQLGASAATPMDAPASPPRREPVVDRRTGYARARR